jgi:hypothetical protein
VRAPVRFQAAMETLRTKRPTVLLETGPGSTLSALGRQTLNGEEFFWAPSLRQSRPEWQQLLESLAHCYVRGAQIDWRSFDRPYPRRTLPLPTYPFQRQKYWVDADSQRPGKMPAPAKVAATSDEAESSTTVYPAPPFAPGGDGPSKASLNGFEKHPGSTALDSDEANGHAPSELLRAASLSKRQELLIDYLLKTLASIAATDPSALDTVRPVTDFGLDSLMALEFKNRIAADLEYTISTVSVLQGPSIRELANEIAGSLASPVEPVRDLDPRCEGVEFPLSYSQKAQWFAHKYMPDSSTFNAGFTVRATPHISWAEFERAVNKLFARHPALRTICFEDEEGRPTQRVLASSVPDLALINAAGWDEGQLREAARREFSQPFALDESLLRLRVFRGTDSDLIIVAVHHLVIDASSLQVCFAELKLLYAAELKGAAAALPSLDTNSFREFIEWEASIADGPEGERLWDYWRKQLGGELPILQLPSSHPRPAVFFAEGDWVDIPFRPGLLSSIQQLAREHRATPYALLLAAYSALLCHYTRQDDIVVGSSVSLRIRPAWRNAVGCFINLLPLRMNLSGNPTFAEHLSRTRDVVLGAIEHQNYPFPLTVKRLRLRRTLERSPIFQAFFNFLTDRSGEFGALSAGFGEPVVPFGSSKLTPYAGIPQQEGQSEIVLRLAEIDGELFGNLSYNTAIVERSVAESMANDYLGILYVLLGNPKARVSDLLPSSTENTEMENIAL